MLKRIVPFVLSAFMLSGCLGEAGSSLGMAGLTGGGSSGASGNLKQDTQSFIKYINTGTFQLLQAVGNMQEAVKNADNAKLAYAQAELISKGNNDVETYKTVFTTLNESNVDKAQLAKVPEKTAKKYLVKSAIHLGAGGAVDKKAIELARRIATSKPTAQDLADGAISNAIDVARFAIDNLPKHIEKAGKWSVDLTDYFSSHKIAPPKPESYKTAAGSSLSKKEAEEVNWN